MNISIKEPCHEDWSKMTPNEQGAFCMVCTKDVVDFSKKSLEEIKAYFSKPKEGKVCGKFNNNQLDALNFDSFFERFMGFKLNRKVAFVIAVTFMSWFMGDSRLSAQNDGHKKGMIAVRHDPNTTTNGNVSTKQDTTKTVRNPEIQTKGEVCTDPKTTKKPKTKSKSTAQKQAKEPKLHLLGDVDINYDERKRDGQGK